MCVSKTDYDYGRMSIKDRCPVCSPSPEVLKRRTILEFAGAKEIKVFIETGTNCGAMLVDMVPHFRELRSIEMSRPLYAVAHERFKNEKKVKLFMGDSGEILGQVIRDIEEPCIFWIDAHWCGQWTAKGELETPVIKEINHIFNHPLKEKHVILIDDAGDFERGRQDYPAVNKIESLAFYAGFEKCFIKNNIIHIYNP